MISLVKANSPLVTAICLVSGLVNPSSTKTPFKLLSSCVNAVPYYKPKSTPVLKCLTFSSILSFDCLSFLMRFLMRLPYKWTESQSKLGLDSLT
jgi:uncharacterized protein YggT (Ycf19 family)